MLHAGKTHRGFHPIIRQAHCIARHKASPLQHHPSSSQDVWSFYEPCEVFFFLTPHIIFALLAFILHSRVTTIDRPPSGFMPQNNLVRYIGSFLGTHRILHAANTSDPSRGSNTSDPSRGYSFGSFTRQYDVSFVWQYMDISFNTLDPSYGNTSDPSCCNTLEKAE